MSGLAAVAEEQQRGTTADQEQGPQRPADQPEPEAVGERDRADADEGEADPDPRVVRAPCAAHRRRDHRFVGIGLRHDEPGDAVRDDTGAERREREDDQAEPDEVRVEAVGVGDAAGNPAEHAIAAAAGEAAGRGGRLRIHRRVHARIVSPDTPPRYWGRP